MDLHEAFRILPVPADGRIALSDPELAREASPLRAIGVAGGTVLPDPLTESVKIVPADLAPGRHLEIPVPAWSACVAAIHDGFCLTGVDGESPDAHAGSCVVYRRRNRDSAVILVAGPDGCRATLAVAAGTEAAPRGSRAT